MNIPDDIILLIREFSNPLTRPDWRVFCPMTALQLHQTIQKTYNQSIQKPYNQRVPPVIKWFLDSYDQRLFSYSYRFFHGELNYGTLFIRLNYV
jgi:hypothetical protein